MSITQARPLLARPPLDDSPVQPPTDQEKYSYLGPQRRWLLGLQALSFSLIAYSVLRFSTADPRLLLFLAPMSLYAVTLVVSLVSGTRRRRVDLDGHRAKVAAWRPERMPSVDVFLPSAGEPLEVLHNTYAYVARLAWPGELRVYVLDDSGRDEVAALAESFGFLYSTRPDRGRMKKAGNLLHGFESSGGDLILVLDADFVPRSDMLHELAPYFDDADVGIVQSPQFFDTRRDMPWLQRCAGVTQELFYRFIQPSRDAVGAAICVGTSAIYRREALLRSGGFAQISHSEDVHTGVGMLKAGFVVRYVPVPVSKGLCPDDPAAFLNQQYRWCTGSMSLLADGSFHESRMLSTRQRLCFWAGFLYYIATAVNAVVAPLPAIVMLWLLPAWVEPMNSVWLLGALSLWFVVLPLVMRGRWRFDVLRVQYLYSFAHLTAIIHLLRGRTREWVATGTAGAAPAPGARRGAPISVSVGRLVKPYVVVTQVLIVAGLVRGTLLYGLHEYWAMIALAVLAAYVQLPLLALRTRPASAPRAVRAPRLTSVTAPRVRLPRQRPEAVLARGSTPAAVAAPLPRQRTATPQVAGTGITGPAQASGPRHFRPDIQGLRAVAILLVILFHAEVPGVTGGYVGVDVFFVISGFLITGQLLREVERRGRVDLLRFYGGRMRRLLPPAVLVIAATVLAARVWDSIFHVRDVVMDALLALVYGINYRLAAIGTDYQHADGAVSPLQHMWSLAVEEQFYIAWPLLIAGLAVVTRGRARRVAIGASLVLLGAGSLYLSVTQSVSNPQWAYFGLHTRAWELLAGALLALGASRLSRLPQGAAAPLTWLGLVALVGSAFAYDADTVFPGTAALLPVAGTMAVIAGGMREHRLGAERLLALRPMQAVGNVSYGWYLWHWPMVVLIPLAVGYALSWTYLLSFSVLALWFAVLTHWLVERPARFSRLATRRWLGVGAVGSGLVAAASAVVLVTLPAFVGTGAAAKEVELDATDGAVVQQALIRGLATVDAPRNLTPQPGEAISDQPVSSADGCHAAYAQVDQPECVYGDPDGDHTMVLFGDSHAQQWLPALDATARELGWRVVAWTKAACPVADVAVDNGALGREYTECASWRERTMARISRLYPDIVVVSQSDSVIGTQVTNPQWGDATSRTLAEIQAQGLPVAYVLDTPMPGDDVPECVATHLDDVGACNLTRARGELYAGRASALDSALSAVGVSVVDPTPWFCVEEACPAVVGNTLVYRDGSHMSASYSSVLAPMTAGLFMERES